MSVMNNKEKTELLKTIKSLLQDYVMIATQKDLYTEEYRVKLDETYKKFEQLMKCELYIVELDWLDKYYEELENEKYSK